MDTGNTDDHLLIDEPDLYDFEKKVDFLLAKSKQQSFRLSSPDSSEIKKKNSYTNNNGYQKSPKLLKLHPASSEEKLMSNSCDLNENRNKSPLNINMSDSGSKDKYKARNSLNDSPILEDSNEMFSRNTKEADEYDEEYDEEEQNQNYSDEVSSIIMEEEEDEEEESEQEIKENEIEKNKKENLDIEEEEETEKEEDDVVEKLLLEEAKDGHSEMDSKENLEFEIALDMYNLPSEGYTMSKRIRYQEKYINVKLLIFPDDPFRGFWDVMLILVLSYTCLIMPYRIAFLSDYDDEIQWTIMDWTTDCIFYVDIIVNFFSAYYDVEDELVVSKKKIFINYISGWFFFDLAGVLPFDKMFDVDRYGNLVRVSRLPRLYKLVRLTRLLKMLKVIKERNKILRKLLDILQIGASFERIFISFMAIFLFCHISCCFWYMAADLNEDPKNWVMEFQFTDQSNIDCYIASFYYIVQTVVTVGYGDIHSNGTIERILTCFLMFIGVFFYSFTIGSLSSLLTNIDSKSAHLETKLNTLLQLKSQYSLDDNLYVRLKRGVKLGLSKLSFDKIEFLDNLPMNLRIELSVIMHRSLVQGIDFFQNKPPRFIAFIGPYLKVIKHGKDEYIFSEGEYADEMYFIKQGNVSLVLKEYENFEYLKIEKGYYFGEVD